MACGSHNKHYVNPRYKHSANRRGMTGRVDTAGGLHVGNPSWWGTSPVACCCLWWAPDHLVAAGTLPGVAGVTQGGQRVYRGPAPMVFPAFVAVRQRVRCWQPRFYFLHASSLRYNLLVPTCPRTSQDGRLGALRLSGSPRVSQRVQGQYRVGHPSLFGPRPLGPGPLATVPKLPVAPPPLGHGVLRR